MPYLCEKHKGMMYIMSMGKCSSINCLGNGKTSSAAFKICEKCARNRNVCQVCLKPI